MAKSSQMAPRLMENSLGLVCSRAAVVLIGLSLYLLTAVFRLVLLPVCGYGSYNKYLTPWTTVHFK
jgi:Zn-dependent membrane protease YugP